MYVGLAPPQCLGSSKREAQEASSYRPQEPGPGDGTNIEGFVAVAEGSTHADSRHVTSPAFWYAECPRACQNEGEAGVAGGTEGEAGLAERTGGASGVAEGTGGPPGVAEGTGG